MAINTGMAQLSEGLVTAATATYMLAVVAYTGEYAFGRRGRVADERHDRHAIGAIRRERATRLANR